LGNGLIISGATPHRLIHFTFDDGPHPQYTPLLLDKLDKAGIKATFFFSASRFESRHSRNKRAEQIAREVLRRGHTVGSHSVAHIRIAQLSAREALQQLDDSERLFEKVFGRRTWLFRAPFGSRSSFIDRTLAERGYTTVMWNIGMADWVSHSAEQILNTFKRVLARNEREEGQRGGVVLLHDTHPWSVEAFDLIVKFLSAENCRILEQNGELYDVVDDLSLFYQPRNQHHPSTVAPPAPSDQRLFKERQAQLVEKTKKYCY